MMHGQKNIKIFNYSVVVRKYIGVVEHDRAWKGIKVCRNVNLRVSHLP